jgi:hypothetical protein
MVPVADRAGFFERQFTYTVQWRSKNAEVSG